MYLRTQLTVTEFKRLLRYRLSSIERPCPQLFFSSPTLTAFISTVSFLNFGALFPVVRQRQVNYPNLGKTERVYDKSGLGVTLNFRVAYAILDGNNDPIEAPPVDVVVHVAIDLAIEHDKDMLSIEVLDTSLDDVLQLVGFGKQTLASLLGANVMELGLINQLKDLSAQFGKKGLLTLRHLELGFDITADVVELRAELSAGAMPSPGVYDEWAQFYSNKLDAFTGTNAWALLLDQRVGTELLAKVVGDKIDENGDFRRDGAVNVYWNAAAPGFHTSVEGELVDFCQCLWGEVDVDIRAWADVRFSLENNRIRVAVHADYKFTDWAEVVCCAVTTVALFPILGLSLAANKTIDWQDYFIGLASGPVGALIGTIAMLNAEPPIKICQTDGEQDFHCDYALPSLSSAAACGAIRMTVNAESLGGTGDGLVLGGRIGMPEVVEPGIGLEADPFTYRPPFYSCGGMRDENSADGFSATLRLFRLPGVGNYDFRVCTVDVLGPFKDLAKVSISELHCPYVAFIDIKIAFALYDYLPLKVIVTTTHGARHAVIAAPARRISDDERRQADLAAILERTSRCYAKSRQWDIGWLVDPVPFIDVERTRQYWMLAGIAAHGAPRVDVVDEAGRSIASIDTSVERAFRLSLVQAGTRISVRQQLEGEAEQAEGAELRAVQVLAGVERTLDFDSAVLALDAVRMSPVHLLLVHERTCVTLFQVSGRGQLTAHRTLATNGMDWVGRQGNTLYGKLHGGELLFCELDSVTGWRAVRRSKPGAVPRCACGAPVRMGAAVEHSCGGLLFDESIFDHLVVPATMAAERTGAAACAGDGVTAHDSGERGAAMVAGRMTNSANVRLGTGGAVQPLRVRGGTLLVSGARSSSLELLRPLSRRQL